MEDSEAYSESCISFPNEDFFLRHLVTMNAAGKVYTVLRGIEAYTEVEGLHKLLYATYAVCMTLGMYWYTRFWQGDDLLKFYNDPMHVLHKWQRTVVFGAGVYYVIFAALFLWAYSDNQHATALSIGLWNIWCFVQLLFAYP